MSAAAEAYGQVDAQALRLGADDRDVRWLIFAGAVLLLLGCVNILEGVAAASGSQFFTARAQYVFGDLNAWGWVIWLIGITQGLTGVAVLVRNQAARWLGVTFALCNALAQWLMIQAYPLWALALFGLDILVVYALVVHGKRAYRPV